MPMPRAANFHYQNPMDSIGASLGRALFGDPAAAQAQQQAQSQAALREAQMRAQDAAAGLDISRTTGQDYQNTSAARAPGIIERYFGNPCRRRPLRAIRWPRSPRPRRRRHRISCGRDLVSWLAR